MAASLNRAEIIGHLGRDPETRNTNDGRKIVTLTVEPDDHNNPNQRKLTND